MCVHDTEGIYVCVNELQHHLCLRGSVCVSAGQCVCRNTERASERARERERERKTETERERERESKREIVISTHTSNAGLLNM